MNKFTIVLMCCLVFLQFEIMMLFLLQFSSLHLWDAQVSFNQSFIDAYRLCLNR